MSQYYKFKRNRVPMPSYWTLGIVVITGLVTLVQFVDGDHGVVSQFLSMQNARLWEGEYWRLLSYSLVHGGILHVFMNLYALWLLGLALESLAGKKALLLTYLASVLGGGIAIGLMGDVMTTTVGASGGVFGLMAALISYIYSRTGSLQRVMEVPAGRMLVIIMGLNLALSFMPGISMLGHVGGLLPGLFMGYLIERWQSDRLEIGEKLGAGLLAIVMAAGAVYATAPQHRKEFHRIEAARTLGFEPRLIHFGDRFIRIWVRVEGGEVSIPDLKAAKARFEEGSQERDESDTWIYLVKEMGLIMETIEEIQSRFGTASNDHINANVITSNKVDAFKKKMEERSIAPSTKRSDLPFQ